MAKTVRDVGDFHAVYLSGGATSALKGIPDIGVLQRNDFTSAIREISIARLPVLADADTGLTHEGFPRQHVAATIFDYISAGAAGCHLEDQVFPKRCGHLLGKELQPADEFCATLLHAVEAAKSSTQDPDFIVCARTDARSVLGLDEVISRSNLYIEKAGVDMIFPEGLQSADEFKILAEEIHAKHPKTFLLANMTEFGQSPLLPASQLAQWGYTAIIYPVTTTRCALGAVERVLKDLKEGDGMVSEGEMERMMSRKRMYEVIGYNPMREWEYPDGDWKKIG